MPEFWAVRCYDCKAFVAQQKKKVQKWKCTICGSKQSVKKIYGTSDRGKDIRQLIVKLNQNRAEHDRQEQEAQDQINEYLQNNNINEIIEQQTQTPTKNIWGDFVEENINKHDNDNHNDEHDNYVLQIPEEYKKKKGRGRKRKNNTQNDYNHSRKRSRYDYEEPIINNKHYNNYNNYEPFAKKIKINDSVSNKTVNKKESKKENDEWNWNVWDENDSNILNIANNNKLIATQQFDTQTNELSSTQSVPAQNMNLPVTQKFNDCNEKSNVEFKPFKSTVSYHKKKNVLESESDEEEFIEKIDNSNAVICVDLEDNKNNNSGNIEITLVSQNERDKLNVYQNEKHTSGHKWSEYV